MTCPNPASLPSSLSPITSRRLMISQESFAVTSVSSVVRTLPTPDGVSEPDAVMPSHQVFAVSALYGAPWC